jgi:hypothetical protein
MIPTIEDILNGLLDGTYLLDKAVRLVEQHIDTVGLRDHFAGLAMQGLLACPVQPQSGPDMYARDAYAVADAMIEARK